MQKKTKSNILKVSKLCKEYKKRPVLKSISLELYSNEVVGLFGSNGSGKTTCFNIIIGLLSPDKGSISLNNKSFKNLTIYQRARLGLSYLPQESCIFSGLSVMDNLKMILQITEKDPYIVDNKARELLEEFAIEKIKNHDAGLLSGGERRRLEIARAVASNPQFILLDEPLAGVDPIAINEIIKLIAQLKNRGVGILVTDHNVRDMLGSIDRAYIIHQGEIIASGDANHITGNETVIKSYLGEHYVK